MRTRGYGMAVLLVVASTPTGGAWLPRFAATRRSQSVFTANSLMAVSPSHGEDSEEIARAWKQVDENMNRHDKEALDVLKEVRDSFQTLEQLWDKEAADLVAQLATQEAMEAAEKESRIQAAKEASEGVQMQAKLDLQQQLNVKEVKQEEEKPEILQAHDVVDDEAAKLVAELASLDAQAKALRESLLESARAEAEGVTMDAKIDQQLVHQAAPKKEKEDSSLLPQDPEAAALVAQLATQDAQELADKELLINKAREDSKMVTMEAKIDQQQQHVKPPPKEDTPSTDDGKPSFLQAHDVVDDEAAKLVAELAFLDAQAQALRDSLIDSAREESEAKTMEAKLDQQQEHEPIVFTPEELNKEEENAPKQDTYLSMAKEMATEQPADFETQMAAERARKLKSQVGALEAAKFGVLIDMAKSNAVKRDLAEAEEDTPLEKLAKRKAAVKRDQEDAPLERLAKRKAKTAKSAKFGAVKKGKAKEQDTPTKSTPTPPNKKKNTPKFEETRLLKSKLAGMEAQQFAIQTDMAKSDAVLADAKVEVPAKVVPVPKKVNTMMNYETKLLKSKQAAMEAQLLAMAMDIAKSEAVMEDTKSLESKMVQKNAEAKRVKAKQTKTEAELLAMTVDIAKSEAVMEDTKLLESELVRKNAEAKLMRAKQAKMEAELLAMTVDIAKSEAVMEDTKSLESEVARKNTETKLFNTKQAKIEADLLAMTVDIAKSEAVMEDTKSLESEVARKNAEAKLFNAKQAKMEADLLAITVDIAKSEAVMEDTKLCEFELDQKKRLQAVRAAHIDAELLAMTVDIAKSDAVIEDAQAQVKNQVKKDAPFGTSPRNGKSRKPLRNGRLAELAAEAEQFSAEIDKARSKALLEDAARLDAACLDTTNIATAQAEKTVAKTSVAAAQVIQPVDVAVAEEKSLVDDAVDTLAEPFFLANQNPNQHLEVIDVEALRSAANEVEKATEMIENHLPESDEKDAILRATREAAESVKKEVYSHKSQPSLADAANNATPMKKGQQVLASEQNMGDLKLEPLPQDVRNHQEDAARFFFAKRAAQEISMKEDPYLLKKNKKELSAAELAAKEHDQVDQELKELFLDVAELSAAEDATELSAAELAAKEHDKVNQELEELFEDVTLGFKDAQDSLARMLDSSEEGREGQSNSTSWGEATP